MHQPSPHGIKLFADKAEKLHALHPKDPDGFTEVVDGILRIASVYPDRIFGSPTRPSQREIGYQVAFSDIGKLLDGEVRLSFVKAALPILEKKELAATETEGKVIGEPTALIEALSTSFEGEVELVRAELEGMDDESSGTAPDKQIQEQIIELFLKRSGLDDFDPTFKDFHEFSFEQKIEDILGLAMLFRQELAETNTSRSNIWVGTNADDHRLLEVQTVDKSGTNNSRNTVQVGFDQYGFGFTARVVDEAGAVSTNRRITKVSTVPASKEVDEIFPRDIKGEFVYEARHKEGKSSTSTTDRRNKEKYTGRDPISDTEQLQFMTTAMLTDIKKELVMRFEVIAGQYDSVHAAEQALDK